MIGSGSRSPSSHAAYNGDHRLRHLCNAAAIEQRNSATAADLVGLAHAMQGDFEPLECEVLDVMESEGKAAVAFRLGGRQVGPFSTAAGVLAPSGQRLAIRIIDILTLVDGLISNIWMVADELGALATVDAVVLVPRRVDVADSEAR
jgi:hypothetical protein